MRQNRPMFLKVVPDQLISFGRGDDSKLRVAIPGQERIIMLVDRDQLFESKDAQGREIKRHFNVKLGAETDRVEVLKPDDDGNYTRESMSVRSIVRAWNEYLADWAAQKGDKVYLKGVSLDMVRDTKFEAGGREHSLKMVCVPDKASALPPVFDAAGNVVPNASGDAGYGTFVVSPDAVRACPDRPGRVDIYLGRENDQIRGYSVRVNGIGQDGKAGHAKVSRTAAEVLEQYESFGQKSISTYLHTVSSPETDPRTHAVLRMVSGNNIREYNGDTMLLRVTSGLSVAIDRDQMHRARTSDGQRMDNAYDVFLPLDKPVVVVENEDSNRRVMSPRDLEETHRSRRAEICAEARMLGRGKDEVYVHDVHSRDVDFDKDRGVAVIRMRDPESVGFVTFELPIENVVPAGKKPLADPGVYPSIYVGKVNEPVSNFTVMRPDSWGQGLVKVKSDRIAQEVGSVQGGDWPPPPVAELVMSRGEKMRYSLRLCEATEDLELGL